MIIAIPITVPIIVVVPVTIGAPFLAIGVIPGLIVCPAFLERFFQFPSGFICLGTVLAVLTKFVTIMLLSLLDAAAAFRAAVIVGRRSWRRRDQQGRVVLRANPAIRLPILRYFISTSSTNSLRIFLSFRLAVGR